MTDGPGAELLYRNAAGLEKAMADADAVRQVGIDAEAIIDSWDPFKTRLENLPYLAWALGVNYWDDDWSENTKRDWVARQWEFKSLRGTLAGIKMVLDFAGRDVSPFGYHVISAILPPQHAFAGPSLTTDQREDWLQRLPQLRVWRVQEAGTAADNKAFLGGVGNLRLRDSRFCLGGIADRSLDALSLAVGPPLFELPDSGTFAALGSQGIEIGALTTADLNSFAVGFGSILGRQQIGQTITAFSEVLLSVTILAKVVGDPQDSLIASVYALDSNGFPSGAALEVSNIVDHSILNGGSNTYITFEFSSVVANLDIGSRYAVIISRTGSLNNSHTYMLQTAAIAGSTLLSRLGGVWVDEGDFNLVGSLEFSGVGLGRPLFESWDFIPYTLVSSSPVFSVPAISVSMFTRGLSIGSTIIYGGAPHDIAEPISGAPVNQVMTAQSFRGSGRLNGITVLAAKVAAGGPLPTDNLVAKIMATDGSFDIDAIYNWTTFGPEKFSLLGTASVSASLISTTPSSIGFAFNPPITIIPGQTYVARFERSNATQGDLAGGRYVMPRNLVGSYADGNAFHAIAIGSVGETSWIRYAGDYAISLQYSGVVEIGTPTITILIPRNLTTSALVLGAPLFKSFILLSPQSLEVSRTVFYQAGSQPDDTVFLVGAAAIATRGRVAQSFIAQDKRLFEVTASIRVSGTPLDGITANVIQILGGAAENVISGNSTVVSGSTISTSVYDPVTFVFDPPIDLTVGTGYAIAFTRTNPAAPTTDYYNMRVSFASVFLMGACYTNQTGIWSLTSRDMALTLRYKFDIGAPVLTILIPTGKTVGSPVLGAPVFSMIVPLAVGFRGIDINQHLTYQPGTMPGDTSLPIGTLPVGFGWRGRVGQSFIAQGSHLNEVMAPFNVTGTPGDAVRANIQLTSTEFPVSGYSIAVIRSSDFVPVIFRFDPPVNTTPGTSYMVVFSRTDQFAPETSFYNVLVSGSNVYPGGNVLTDYSGPWQPTATRDMSVLLKYSLGLPAPRFSMIQPLPSGGLVAPSPTAVAAFATYARLTAAPLSVSALSIGSTTLAFLPFVRTDIMTVSNEVSVGNSPTATSASFTPPNNSLLVLIAAIQGNGTSGALSISGGGLTWTARVISSNIYQSGPPGKNVRLLLYTANVTTGAPMQITVSDSGTVTTDKGSVLLSIMAYTGHNMGSPGGATVSNTTPGDAGLTMTMTAPLSSSQVIAWRMRSDVASISAGINPGGGWTAVHSVSSTTPGNLNLDTMVREGSTSTSVTFTDTSSNSSASSWVRLSGAYEFRRGS